MISKIAKAAKYLLHKRLVFSESPDSSWGKGAIRYDIHIHGENVASAIVRPNPRKELGGMTLSDLQTKEEFQGMGLGGKLLDHVISIYKNDDLYLRPEPYKNKALSEKELRKFYSSHGFVNSGKELMKYKK